MKSNSDTGQMGPFYVSIGPSYSTAISDINIRSYDVMVM